MEKKGIFIVFEGLDGSGSSTQAELLRDYLKKFGLRPHLTKEPTNNLIGGLIRGALTKEWHASNRCFQLLFSADRAHHLDREIVPALEKGIVVISDRYFFSTMAFGSLDCDLEWLKALNSKFLVPDVVYLIKVPPEECIRRIGKSRLEFELFEEVEKLKKVWDTYEKLAKEYPGIHVIDGTQPVEKVHNQIVDILTDHLNNGKE
ncbi:dTMP kinase [Candidatus Woesearchaeota archaeon]|nr:dTMP kinase [Candidatus Woesearchaeota archaeon]